MTYESLSDEDRKALVERLKETQMTVTPLNAIQALIAELSPPPLTAERKLELIREAYRQGTLQCQDVMSLAILEDQQ